MAWPITCYNFPTLDESLFILWNQQSDMWRWKSNQGWAFLKLSFYILAACTATLWMPSRKKSMCSYIKMIIASHPSLWWQVFQCHTFTHHHGQTTYHTSLFIFSTPTFFGLLLPMTECFNAISTLSWATVYPDLVRHLKHDNALCCKEHHYKFHWPSSPHLILNPITFGMRLSVASLFHWTIYGILHDTVFFHIVASIL